MVTQLQIDIRKFVILLPINIIRSISLLFFLLFLARLLHRHL